MRIFVPSEARAFWRDRAATPIIDSADIKVAGGGTSTIVDYTVPASRIAVFTYLRRIALLEKRIPTGQQFEIELRIEDLAPSIVLFEETRWDRNQGAGTYMMPFFGEFQLPAGFRIRIFGKASATYGDGRAMCSLIGTEYGV